MPKEARQGAKAPFVRCCKILSPSPTPSRQVRGRFFLQGGSILQIEPGDSFSRYTKISGSGCNPEPAKNPPMSTFRIGGLCL